jgi:hypothetical protein
LSRAVDFLLPIPVRFETDAQRREKLREPSPLHLI